LKKIIIVLLLFIFAIGCASKLPDWQGPPDREDAFPDMSFEDSSPRRKASLELTKEGMNYARRGFYLNAMKKYEKAIDVDPTNPFPYFQYGVARLGVNQHDQSFVMLEEAADKFGENRKWQSQILTYKGLNHKALNEFEKARECFRAAVKLDRNNEKARDGLASVYGK